MKSFMGGSIAAAVTAISAIASAQPFETCTDARNYGANTSEVAVGQVMARVSCDEKALPDAEEALASAMRGLTATWTGSAELKICYYQGLHENAVNRLQRDYERCSDNPAFQRLSLETVSRLAVATFAAMADTEPSLLFQENLKTVFDIDYRFLGAQRACKSRVEAVERQILESAVERYAPQLGVLETEICVNPCHGQPCSG